MTNLALGVGLALLATATFVVGCAATWLARRCAIRIGFVDRPGGHKSHRDAMPYGGGTAVFAASWLPAVAFLVAAWITPQAWIEQEFGETIRAYVGGARHRTPMAAAVLLGGIVLHVLGLLDDRRALGAVPKLVVILIVAIAVPWMGHVRIAEFAGEAAAIALTAAWFVVLINAFNFLDNMDGLSAGVAVICLSFLAVCGALAGQVFVPALAWLFAGAIAGFLVFNFPPARIFMGDAGSLFIGYAVAVVSSLTTYYESGQGTPPYALAIPLVVLAVPLYDFVTVIAIRIREGRNPMRGDQRHFSHRLVDHGFSRRFSVLTIYLATATTGVIATLLPGADLRQTLTIVSAVILILSIVAILESPAEKTA